jgi:hypothetical protein
MPFLLEIGIKAIVVLQRLSHLQDTDMFVCQLTQAGRGDAVGVGELCMCVSGDGFLCVHYCLIVGILYKPPHPQNTNYKNYLYFTTLRFSLV